MKSEIHHVPDAEFAAMFPLAASVPGWRYRLEEVSAGVYECRAGDQWGRRVSRKGTDPDALIKQCEQDVREIVGAPNGGT